MLKLMFSVVAIVISVVVLFLLAIYIYQERLIFYPEKLPREHRFEFDWPVEEVFLPSAGSAELHALYFKAENPKGTVLYFHGNAGSLRSWGFIAEDFITRGYNVFMPDYRGYGKSTGRISENALLQDARLAFNYVQSQHNQNIIIYGRSLGTGIATHLAAASQPSALILETPFTNFTELAQVHFPYLPATLLLRYSFRADKWIKEVNCPAYIIHGTRDEVVPYSLGEKLAQMAGPKAEFTTIKGGAHNNLSSFAGYQFLLDRVLGKPRPVY